MALKQVYGDVDFVNNDGAFVDVDDHDEARNLYGGANAS
jgi:hypothetical protein